MDKLRMVSQIKPKYRKWTPGVTGTIDRDKYNRNVIGPYDYEPLQYPSVWSLLSRSWRGILHTATIFSLSGALTTLVLF